MGAKIKVMLQIEIPRLNEDIELASIRHRLNDYVSTLIPRINIQELMDWSLLICVTFRSTNGIGVFKKARRYSSNKEFEFSISVTIPNENQVSYGLPKVKEAFYLPLNEKNFYKLKLNFDNYNDLYDYILESSKDAIDLAFTKGITCNGKKIKFQV